MSYDIRNKTVLVTGANRGIGKAIVEGLIQAGAAKVYAAVRSLDSAAPLVAKHGDKIVPIQVDLADPASIEAAAKAAPDVQVVVNNAGVFGSSTPLSDNLFSDLEHMLNVNLHGFIHVARAFAPVLKANGGGVLAQLNSVVSLKAFPDFTAYCASKAASYSVTQSLREILGAQGTQVISVHPGPIATNMGAAAGLTHIAGPPSLVADSLLEAIRTGSFHAFPDSMARQIGGAYQSFAEQVIETSGGEG